MRRPRLRRKPRKSSMFWTGQPVDGEIGVRETARRTKRELQAIWFYIGDTEYKVDVAGRTRAEAQEQLDNVEFNILEVERVSYVYPDCRVVMDRLDELGGAFGVVEVVIPGKNVEIRIGEGVNDT